MFVHPNIFKKLVKVFILIILFTSAGCIEKDPLEDIFLITGKESKDEVIRKLLNVKIDTQQIVKEFDSDGLTEKWTFRGENIFNVPTSYEVLFPVKRKGVLNVHIWFENEDSVAYHKLKALIIDRFPNHKVETNSQLSKDGKFLIAEDSTYLVMVSISPVKDGMKPLVSILSGKRHQAPGN